MNILEIKTLVLTIICCALIGTVCFSGAVGAAGHAAEEKGPAILLVTFGTSVENAQTAFQNIEHRVKEAFPKTEVRWAYTSSIIRNKLAKKGIRIDSPEMALSRLMDEGYTKVAVQSLHMIPGAEFHEINVNSRLFAQMAGGIDTVMVSQPLLISDATMDKVLNTVQTNIIPEERKAEDAVILMGHGTHHPSDAIYGALMYKAQKRDANLYVGTVEGAPSFAEIKEMLLKKKTQKAYLIPFMTVAGDHAMNDMAGDEPDSWRSQLTKAGITAVPVMKGLAEFDPIVDMWIDHLKNTMIHFHK
mgnify:FL=1